MENTLGNHIRECRKNAELTQEQLAEAMGVTVGAVSKWENGSANPELGILMELAQFFQVSIDSLMGYELSKSGADKYQKEITACRKQRDYESGCRACRQALVKYPNHFQIVTAAAQLYKDAGMSSGNDPQYYEKALELYQKALGLLSQRTDQELSREEINTQISELYLFLGQTDNALAYAKEHNTCGVNDILIGSLYCHKKNYEKAEKQLGMCFMHECIHLLEAESALVKLWFQIGCYESAIDLLLPLKNMWSRIKTEEVSYADRLIASMDTSLAIAYYFKQEPDPAKCRESLAAAITRAKQYDKAPSFTLKLRSLSVERFFNDDMGEQAKDAIRKLIDSVPGRQDDREKLQCLFTELMEVYYET